MQNTNSLLLSIIGLIIIIALGVIFFINNISNTKDFGFIDSLLREDECPDETTKKISKTEYKCNEGLGSYVRITVKNVITNNLDEDENGTKETFIIWEENFGGSGTFINQSIYTGKQAIAPQDFLGDRIKIENMKFENGLISYTETNHLEGYPFCCPTNKVERLFQWDGNALLPSKEV